MSKYEPGSGLAAVQEDTAALVDGDVDAAVVERIWRAQHDASGGDRVGAAIGILVEVFGVTALPAFSLAVTDTGGTRVVVRGAFEAVIDGGDHAGDIVRATGPTFWAERHVTDATGVVLRGSGTPGAESLWLTDGIVRAGSVALGTAVRISDPFSTPAAPSEEGAAQPLEEDVDVSSVPVPSLRSAARLRSSPSTDGTDVPIERPSIPVADGESTTAPTATAVEVDAGESTPTDDDTPESPASASARSGDTWSPTDDTFSAPPESAASAVLPVEEGTTSYDDLIFGHTRAATVEGAAVRTTEEPALASPRPIGAMPAAGDPTAATQLGDHDGLTSSAEQLAALRAQRGSAAMAPALPAPEVQTTNVALVTSTGERVVLDRGAVVGVQPSAVRATGIVPHLIAVPSPAGWISRRHLEVRVEASHILAVDLDSTNGTRLLRIGAEPVRLHPGAPTLLVAGDRLDLGDGVELSFEGLR